MGRRKTHDRDEVAHGAMHVFWRQGYAATTIQDLEQTLQLNRYSLFTEFGSKEGLFEAALDVYEAQIVAANLSEMEADGASPGAIVAFFDRFRTTDEQAALAGCMLCNAAVEQAPDSARVRARARRYFDRLGAAFLNALGPAHRPLAPVLASATLVQARNGVTPQARADALDGLVGRVRSLSLEAS